MIKFHVMDEMPLEMHKVRIVQKLNLKPIDERAKAINEAGNNTFLLKTDDVFLDMLTDSGVNAMSDKQLAAMMQADDAYAGSATFYRLESKVKEIMGLPFFLPAHQGRACENILSNVFVQEGNIVPMNYHFTTTKAHITKNGGSVVEFLTDEGVELNSENPFKGNMDIEKLSKFLESNVDNVPFVRMEAGTNLIGGQPFSLANCREVSRVCKKFKVRLILDASLLQDNLYFIKTREKEFADKSIREITALICEQFDIIYFSARKLGFAKGGGICLRNKDDYEAAKELVPLYEGFLTYGGMSTREMEAITIGLDETMDFDVISQGPIFIEYMVKQLQKHKIPVVTPAGGLGCHLNAGAFVPHIPQTEYPSGSLACALYLISGIRGMERGTMSEDRNLDGSEHLSDVELLRLALPRRVFTVSQINYAVDRIVWLYEHRDLIGGLKFKQEPKVLRFFTGTLEPTSNWQENLVNQFKKELKNSL